MDVVFDQDCADWKQEIENRLKNKVNEKEALLKLISIKDFADKRPTVNKQLQHLPHTFALSSPSLLPTTNSPLGRDIDTELAVIEKDITKLNGNTTNLTFF